MREKRKRRWERKGGNEKKIRIKRNLKNNKIKKIKIDNNKNIAKNFCGTLVGSVGSVQCQIILCSKSLQLHLKCTVSA